MVIQKALCIRSMMRAQYVTHTCLQTKPNKFLSIAAKQYEAKHFAYEYSLRFDQSVGISHNNVANKQV